MGQNLRGNRNCQENGEKFFGYCKTIQNTCLAKDEIAHEKEMRKDHGYFDEVYKTWWSNICW